MTGRRGYGRAIHRRSSLAQLSPSPGLVLAAGTGILEASEALLARRTSRRFDDVVVTFEDGSLGLASTSAVMRALAELNAFQAVHDPLTGLGNRGGSTTTCRSGGPSSRTRSCSSISTASRS